MVGNRNVLYLVIGVLIVAVGVLSYNLYQAKKAPEKAKDPVCGIVVDKDPNLSANYKGETYYFCSKADMDKFKKEPEKYAKKK